MNSPAPASARSRVDDLDWEQTAAPGARRAPARTGCEASATSDGRSPFRRPRPLDAHPPAGRSRARPGGDPQPSYALDPFALTPSEYQLVHEPAGLYDESLSQEIQWYPSANEAAFRAAYEEVLNTALWAPFSDASTPVNLDSIGQGERGAILRVVYGNPTGGTDYAAVIALSRGRATDLVVAWSTSQIQPTDVQTLAQSMATRLDAGISS